MSLSVKVRVMPACWYLLVRCFVRVDNVVIKSFESRLFHRFDNPTVVWREDQVRIFDAPRARPYLTNAPLPSHRNGRLPGSSSRTVANH
jgi:hypothetical protein